ncbi:hypothetical protein KAR91_56830 [Candidatus Pacearchaeota archaeon]|nr:hypothetical protein [Candidatus Pacearchaeota archaeon]
MSSCVLLGGIGSRRYVEVYKMPKRIVKRKVTLELTELYEDGSALKQEIEVSNVDEVDRSKSAKELTRIALSKLGEKDV